VWITGREGWVDRLVVYLHYKESDLYSNSIWWIVNLGLAEDKNIRIFSFYVRLEALVIDRLSKTRYVQGGAKRTFFWLAARPQTFHDANLSVPGGRGAKDMCTGSTLFVGFPVDEIGLEAFFDFFLEGSSFTSSSESVPLRLAILERVKRF